ncbi:MAG: helix-turn-helix domain-containing protein, partial [Ilumatobacter sp.]|uniref:helix-turn-helix domain-containing protein n=1 Tax=Ilumatobacter sp. TaxID=1967498 RepID=UPI003C757FAF
YWQTRVMLDRSLEAVTDVLATVPHVMFSIKSVDGTYLAANRAFAERAGVVGQGEVVGRTAAELFPPDLAEQYEAQDRSVIDTGLMLTNELEVITRPDRSYGWFLTSKSRWTDDSGTAAGVVCVSVDLRTAVDGNSPHARLADAVDVARRRYAERLEVADLAAAAGMTVSRLERTARRVLGLTPKQLIMRFRLEEALRLITTTDVSLADVATRCGYYDQSAFGRHFRKVVGSSPAAYRAAHRLV